MHAAQPSFEVLIVDDGSPDGTGDLAEALREMTNELEWKIIDGPPDLNKDAKFKEKVRDLFAEMAGVEWIKKSGGAKYQGEKICGHHLPNCTLRPLATPPLPVEEESD